jgi:hypothetical protein
MSIDQKIPLTQSMNLFTDRKIQDAFLANGRQFPCHVVSAAGSIVTVAFDITLPNQTLPNITVPVFGPQYIRYPLQAGDAGMVVAADASIAFAAGLSQGKGQPDSTNWGNLAQLVFLPIGNQNWFSVDGNILFMYGPNGVELTTKNRDCTLLLTSSGIVINLNGGNLTVNNGNVTMAGNLTVDGSITGLNGMAITGTATNNGTNIGSTHVHGGVQSGSSNTATPH